METFAASFPAGPAYDGGLAIVRRLQEAGHTAYFVGGCVRDALLGRPVADYDVATDAPPARVRELFPKSFAVGEAFGVMLVVEGGRNYEVATFRSESGYADLRRPSNVTFSTADVDVRRRDFTINGLFFDPVADEGIDYVGGVSDLRDGVLRTIGPPAERFDEDALRLLRAIRFAATFDFWIDGEAFDAICDRAESLLAISGERIGEEWNKALLKAEPSKYLRLLLELRVGNVTMPEIAALDGFTAAGLEVLTTTERRLVRLRDTELFATLDQEARLVLLWAALFFEAGRPAGTRRKEQGIWRGEAMMSPAGDAWRAAAARLKFSNRRRRDVAARLDAATEWQNFDQLVLWRQRELLGDPLAALDEALLEAFAAVYKTAPAPLEAARKLRLDLAARREAPLPPPLLDGGDLMRELALEPSALLGVLLEELRRDQLNRKFATRDEALAAARTSLDRRRAQQESGEQ